MARKVILNILNIMMAKLVILDIHHNPQFNTIKERFFILYIKNRIYNYKLYKNRLSNTILVKLYEPEELSSVCLL